MTSAEQRADYVAYYRELTCPRRFRVNVIEYAVARAAVEQ